MTGAGSDSTDYRDWLAAVQAFHHKHDLARTGGEDLVYRVTLMAEELGEIAACVSKGKPRGRLAEECADLLILLIGTAIAGGFDLDQAFWHKIHVLEGRRGRMVNGHLRVSDFRDAD